MTATEENGWELSVTHLIAAPPEVVRDIMANRIDEWWCPKLWRAEFDRLKRHAGGASNCTMYDPDGDLKKAGARMRTSWQLCPRLRNPPVRSVWAAR